MLAISELHAGRLAPNDAATTIRAIAQAPPAPTWLFALAAAAGAVALAVIFGLQHRPLRNALLRLAVPGALSTAVMTGNLTDTVLSLLDTLSPNQPSMKGATERLKRSLQLLFGFLVGCAVAAAAVSVLGDWAWSLPLVLAGIACVLR
jgi:uncharacterized membrane protein YoaK (UPF0700 family)